MTLDEFNRARIARLLHFFQGYYGRRFWRQSLRKRLAAEASLAKKSPRISLVLRRAEALAITLGFDASCDAYGTRPPHERNSLRKLHAVLGVLERIPAPVTQPPPTYSDLFRMFFSRARRLVQLHSDVLNPQPQALMDLVPEAEQRIHSPSLAPTDPLSSFLAQTVPEIVTPRPEGGQGAPQLSLSASGAEKEDPRLKIELTYDI